ncbi:DNA-binding MarR family transcriptional regulator [Pseudonocardia cypriaca]|uniref:DNA-binding MarR family transcriptional regulator n=2 Tax=Pseudonocardia cypriaca TaxID=882449 RepID=A0A543GCL4_9PSEU|nr:DNA-binding MarR family transcriptional regulator [Pseudonocardia cypriaca]
MSGAMGWSGMPEQQPDGHGIVEPSTRIAYLVRMLANALNQQVEQALRPVGLTQAQLAALGQLAICAEGWLSGAELGRRAGITAQGMSTALAGLQSRGLVERGPHPSRGRVIRVWITEDGRRLLERAQRLTAPVDMRATALLSVDEQRQLREFLLRAMAGVGVQAPGTEETA